MLARAPRERRAVQRAGAANRQCCSPHSSPTGRSARDQQLLGASEHVAAKRSPPAGCGACSTSTAEPRHRRQQRLTRHDEAHLRGRPRPWRCVGEAACCLRLTPPCSVASQAGDRPPGPGRAQPPAPIERAQGTESQGLSVLDSGDPAFTLRPAAQSPAPVPSVLYVLGGARDGIA
jgi:hypothetical protein